MDLREKTMSSRDKQISWQGIFKGIMQQPIDPLKAEDLAYDINKRLHEMYPITENMTSYSDYPAPKYNQPARGSGAKQKPSQCPKCGSMAYYFNQGVSPKTGLPYANHKCAKCKHIEWVTTNYEQKRAKAYEIKSFVQQNQIDELTGEEEANQNEIYGRGE